MIKNKKSSEVISVKNLPLGSYVKIDNTECLGADIKEVKETLRCLYSKKIKLEFNKLIFDSEKHVSSYKSILEILSYLIEQQSLSVKAGIDTARKDGKQIGRRKIQLEDLPESFIENYDSYKKGNITKIEFSKLCSCSRPTLDRWIKCYEKNAEI